VEYVDAGISGAKDKRPALDELLKDAKRRRFDVLVCWRLDRLGRNLRHLVTMLEDLNHVGVAFVWARASTAPLQPESCNCISWRHWRSSSENGFGSGWWRV